MVTSMIPSVDNIFVNKSIVDMRFLSAYIPLINYDWSTTTTSGLRYLKDVGSTPTYNASMYFGRGAYLNGVDQSITVPINTIIQTALKRVNGIVTINETSQILTNYVISGLGVHKDYYLFTRLLTTAEKDSYTNTPEAFYAMAQADSTCLLNMPMCETDGYVRNMKSYSEGIELLEQDTTLWLLSGGWSTDGVSLICNSSAYDIATIPGRFIYTINDIYYCKIEIFNYVSGTLQLQAGSSWIDLPKANGLYFLVFKATGTEFNLRSKGGFIGSVSTKNIKQLSGVHAITNYTTSVRDNAKNLQYGLQTCKFVRDSLGMIQTASDYLVCNGTGYAIIPSHADTVNIKMTVNPTSLSGNLLSGGVTKTLTGLTLNVDNDVVISNVTPTGAITLASGFSGTIKTYTEELV